MRYEFSILPVRAADGLGVGVSVVVDAGDVDKREVQERLAQEFKRLVDGKSSVEFVSVFEDNKVLSETLVKGVSEAGIDVASVSVLSLTATRLPEMQEDLESSRKKRRFGFLRWK